MNMKFEKFANFVIEGALFPLIVALVASVLQLVLLFTNSAVFGMFLNVTVVCIGVAAIWMVLFLVAFVGEKIIDWREVRKYRKENPNEEASN